MRSLQNILPRMTCERWQPCQLCETNAAPSNCDWHRSRTAPIGSSCAGCTLTCQQASGTGQACCGSGSQSAAQCGASASGCRSSFCGRDTTRLHEFSHAHHCPCPCSVSSSGSATLNCRGQLVHPREAERPTGNDSLWLLRQQADAVLGGVLKGAEAVVRRQRAARHGRRRRRCYVDRRHLLSGEAQLLL